MKSNQKDTNSVSKRFFSRFKEQYKTHKGATITYLILRGLVILVMVLAFLNRNYENALLCILSLILFLIPTFIEQKFHIEIPSLLESIILGFIFASAILGEIGGFYIYVQGWDTLLHTLNGFLCAAIGLSLFDLLNDNESLNFKASPFFLVLVAFCFSMTVGVLWEFFEFFQDFNFGNDMQKDTIVHHINSMYLSNGNSIVRLNDIKNVVIDNKPLGIDGYLDIGLIDTMKDLFVNFLGAVTFSIFGYFYEKQKGKSNTWVENLMPYPMEEERIEELNTMKSDKKEKKNRKSKKAKNRTAKNKRGK